MRTTCECCRSPIRRQIGEGQTKRIRCSGCSFLIGKCCAELPGTCWTCARGLRRHDLHQLAVLRGVIDGETGKYFGSWGALLYWIDEAASDGLIERAPGKEWTATPYGQSIHSLVLIHLPRCRQTFWRGVDLERILKQ